MPEFEAGRAKTIQVAPPYAVLFKDFARKLPKQSIRVKEVPICSHIGATNCGHLSVKRATGLSHGWGISA